MIDSAEVKTLTIDEKQVSGRRGQTILEVALENEIEIPTLCHLEGLSDIGACRLCMVEIKGSNKLQPACVTTIYEGMEVSTNTERLQKYRRNILELLFAERNHVCAVCVSNGHCELQAMAQKQGLTHVRLPYRNPALPVDASHERFTADHNRCILCTRCVRICAEIEGAHVWDVMGRGTDSVLITDLHVDASHERFTVDHNRCILCTRCVRVCAEIEGAHIWDVMGRGIDSIVITDLNQPWGESACTRCGKCVQVCPTGALFDKSKVGSDHPKYPDFLPYLNLMREAQ